MSLMDKLFFIEAKHKVFNKHFGIVNIAIFGLLAINMLITIIVALITKNYIGGYMISANILGIILVFVFNISWEKSQRELSRAMADYEAALKLEVKEDKYDYTREQVIMFIEDAYEELDMMLDCCQGCCEDLDGKFEELRAYRKAVEILGGDIENDQKLMIDRYYKRCKEREAKENENISSR